MLRTFRAGNGRDLAEWQALIDDLTPPLPPAGDPQCAEEMERFRRVVATLLALLALSSRLLDAASTEPDEWLRNATKHCCDGSPRSDGAASRLE